jgi:hypothetical protein
LRGEKCLAKEKEKKKKKENGKGALTNEETTNQDRDCDKSTMNVMYKEKRRPNSKNNMCDCLGKQPLQGNKKKKGSVEEKRKRNPEERSTGGRSRKKHSRASVLRAC